MQILCGSSGGRTSIFHLNQNSPVIFSFSIVFLMILSSSFNCMDFKECLHQNKLISHFYVFTKFVKHLGIKVSVIGSPFSVELKFSESCFPETDLWVLLACQLCHQKYLSGKMLQVKIQCKAWSST